MADPVRLEPPATGPVALARWAWGAYREAKARGLVRLDPARQRRWWVGPVMCFVGFLLPVPFVLLPLVALILSWSGSRPLSFEAILLPGWVLLLSLIPLIALVRGARVFLAEHHTDTMDALRMMPVPRGALMLRRFAAAFRPTFWALAGLTPGCLLLPPALAGNDAAEAFLIGLAVWLTQMLFAFAGCAFGVYASARHAGFARALLDACPRLFGVIILLAFGVYCIDNPTMDPLGSVASETKWIVFFFGTAAICLGGAFYALRTAALRFDDWAEKAEES